MSFYLSAVDDLLRHPDDQQTIGLLLCRSKNQTTVEYTLRDLNKLLGVAEYQIQEMLPQDLQNSLPTIEELEHALSMAEGSDTPV